MSEFFSIPVVYKGEKLIFDGRLSSLEGSKKIRMLINGVEVNFEKDRENKFHAVVNSFELNVGKKIDIELIKSILGALETRFN